MAAPEETGMRTEELRGLAAELAEEPPGRLAVTITLPTRPDGLDRGETLRLRHLAVRAAYDARTDVLVVPAGTLEAEQGIAAVVRW